LQHGTPKIAQSISHARVPWRSATRLQCVIGNDNVVETVPFQNPQNSRNVHITFVNERLFIERRLQEFYFWQTNPPKRIFRQVLWHDAAEVPLCLIV
jgi:hypothetical protein